MRKLTALVLTAVMLLVLLPPAKAQADADYSWVRVRLTTNNATTLKLGITGSYFIEENGAEFSGGSLTVNVVSGQMTVTHSADGLLYTGKSVAIRRVRVDRTAGYVTLNSRSYLGHFKLKVTSSGYIQVVNEVPMAHYLYGVVAYEMNNLYPLDALKAQALAAKGYVINQMNSSAEYDIGDTSSEQVYKGYNSSYTNVFNAVDSTLNEVLTVNGSILRTYFAASNGGETNLPSNAWSGRGNAGYGIAIDEYDFANTLALSQKRRLPIGALNQYASADTFYAFLLNLASAQAGVTLNYIDYIYDIQTYDPQYSGSVRNLTRGMVTLMASAVDANGAVLSRVENLTVSFRLSELSAAVMTNSSLRIFWGELQADGYYYFYRVRYGHGVGLSQRGAEQRAKAGHSYVNILAFYYPGASLSYLPISAPADPVNANRLPTGPFVLAETTGGVNFRKKANSSSDKIATLSKGVQVYVYSRENGWAYAVYNGVVGYLSEDYLKYLDAQPSASASPTASSGTAQPYAYGRVTGSGVNFRTQPSTSTSSVIAKLAKNTALELYEKSGSWYFVSVSGVMGYISTSYVEITGYPSQNTATPAATPTATPAASPNDSSAPVVSAPTIIAYGETTGKVNFRTGPSTSYNVLVELTRGVQVAIYASYGDWYYATNGTLTGYLSKNYIRLTTGISTPAPAATPTPTPSAAQTAVSVGYINNGNTNFRTGPDVSYGILRVLDKNTGIYVYSQSGTWCYVLAGSQFGYVHKDYVTVTGTAMLGTDGKPVSGTDLSGAIGKGATTANVNFRASATSSSQSYGTLAKGTELLLYAEESGWYKVKLSDGKTGYVSGKYIKVVESYATDSVVLPGTGEGNTIIGTGVTTGNVNFRTGPSTTAKKIVQLKKGVSLTLYALVGGWYEAEYNGTHGYLSAKYVKVTSNSTSNRASNGGGGTAQGGALTLAAGKAAGTLNFRSTPQTSAALLGTFSQGTMFEILGQTGEWYYVLHKGVTGFVYKAYTSVLSAGSAGIPAVSASAKAQSAVTTAQVNLRAGTSTSSSVLQLMSKGTGVTAYLLTDGWYLLSCGGSFGYAVDDYVKVS